MISGIPQGFILSLMTFVSSLGKIWDVNKFVDYTTGVQGICILGQLSSLEKQAGQYFRKFNKGKRKVLPLESCNSVKQTVNRLDRKQLCGEELWVVSRE